MYADLVLPAAGRGLGHICIRFTIHHAPSTIHNLPQTCTTPTLYRSGRYWVVATVSRGAWKQQVWVGRFDIHRPLPSFSQRHGALGRQTRGPTLRSPQVQPSLPFSIKPVGPSFRTCLLYSTYSTVEGGRRGCDRRQGGQGRASEPSGHQRFRCFSWSGPV